MERKFFAGLLVSVVVGVAITLLSGLFRDPLTRIGVDVVQRGIPLPWIIQVIPRAGHILWTPLVADLAFWVVITILVSTLVLCLSGRRSVTQTTPLKQ